MKFNLKYLTPLFSLMATIFISSCSDKTMFKREIKKCAKVSKPGLLSVYQWQNNFHYMYEKANLDSILSTTDTIYVIIKISLRYSSPFYVELFAKEWEYYLWGSHLSQSLQKCYESNINNDRLLLFLLNREDLSCLSDNDKYLAKEERRMSILMLCTKDSKGKLKREIICN